MFETIENNLSQLTDCKLNNITFSPLFVKIKLLWDCNLQCKMCNHWRKNDPVILPPELFIRVIDELAEMGCERIHFTGGEPLLYPKIKKLFKHCKHNSIKVTMTTNGTLITETNASLLCLAGLKKVNISLDSPDPAIHDALRGNTGYWQKTISGIKHIRPFVKHLNLNVVVNAFNYQSLKALPDLAKELKVDGITFIPVYEHTPDVKNMTISQIRHYNETVAPEILKKTVEYGLTETPADIYIFGSSEEEISFSSKGDYAHGYYSSRPCYAPWFHSMIDSHGQVKICCNMRMPVLGNITRQSFKEIWLSENYLAARSCQSIPVSPRCNGCLMFRKMNLKIESLIQEKIC